MVYTVGQPRLFSRTVSSGGEEFFSSSFFDLTGSFNEYNVEYKERCKNIETIQAYGLSLRGSIFDEAITFILAKDFIIVYECALFHFLQ